MSGLSVSSAEFQRAFGRYREVALREPVTITNHGRDSVVLVGAGEYQRLKSRDRVTLPVEDLSDAELLALSSQELPADLAQFDHELVLKP